MPQAVYVHFSHPYLRNVSVLYYIVYIRLDSPMDVPDVCRPEGGKEKMKSCLLCGYISTPYFLRAVDDIVQSIIQIKARLNTPKE